MADSLDTHYTTVSRAIADGRVVPFLGAGVNLCGRPSGLPWRRDQNRYLPSGGELARYLAEYFMYLPSEAKVHCSSCGSEIHLGGTNVDCALCASGVDLAEKPQDLVRVAQHVALTNGSGPLYAQLHSLFDADYPPTALHNFLASLPAVLRAKGNSPHYQLIVTTNYDDVLERAFQAVHEPFDMVSYVAEGEHRGKFLHWPPDGEVCLIDKPNEYRGLSLDQRSVILKIHGTTDRTDEDQDSYIITEDHYIDYLTRTDLSNLVPAMLAARLRRSHFLFLGYGLRDWNLRVILHRIWGERKLSLRFAQIWS